MRRTMAFFVLWSVMVGTVWAEDPVYFADAKLKAEIENKLGVSDPTPSDMLDPKLDQLYLNFKGISDLTGLEYAHNMWRLHFNVNGITDLTPLAGLTQLTHLEFQYNQVTDLSPLVNLTSLQYINFQDNKVSNLSPLSNMTHLMLLYADRNKIVNISPLSSLTNLGRIELDENQIFDISVLSSLGSLYWIDLDRNNIQDISVLTRFHNVQYIDVHGNPLNSQACEVYLPKIIANNPGADIRYDECTDTPPASTQYTLTLSSSVGGSVTIPGEGVNGPFAKGSMIEVEASAEPGYIFSGWSGSAVTAGQVSAADQATTMVTLHGNYTLQANFVEWVQLTLYVDDDGTGDPAPGDPQVSDPQENGMPTHPFDQIQEAIDAALDGTSIMISPGTYYENIEFQGKTLKLIGLDPNDPNAQELPVVYGIETGPVVRFSGGEGPGSLLMGLTICGGQGEAAGGIECFNSDLTFSHCLMTGNRSTTSYGAGIYCADSNVIIIHCTIADNAGGVQGAGVILQDSHAIVVNSIIWGNQPQQVQVLGQSFFFAQYTDVSDSLLGPGNINVDPAFVQPGHWSHVNFANLILDPYDPQAVWMQGDYHLQAEGGRWHDMTQTWIVDDMTSPCIDAGDPINAVGYESEPHGDRINMGVYGGTSAASRSFVQDDELVHFMDDILKAAVQNELKIWWDPTPEDMAGLFKLKSIDTEISDLTGLEYAVNLQELNLRRNPLNNISPILGLSHLQYLNLSETGTTNLSPLSDMTQLKSLDVHGNSVSNISALSNLTGLEELVLRDNLLEGGVPALSKLRNLEKLDLQENRIYDLSGILGMTKLKELNLYFNLISSVNILSRLTLLEKLYLHHNQIFSISGLVDLTHLKELTLEGNFLNQDAYTSHLQTIIDNNPGIQISYDPNPY